MSLRVVVVDDSLICRTLMKRVLEVDGDISVVALAANGDEALRLIAQHRPDLVTIDWQMPGMNGLDLVSRVMASQPLPILLVTGQPTDNGQLAFETLRRGALDLAEKPGDVLAEQRLRECVRSLARVPVVRHVRAVVNENTRLSRPKHRPHIVALGASAGGPTALASIVAALPSDFPLPVAIVQHLPNGFARAFADMLRSKTALRVHVIDAPVQAAAGCVFLPADGHHLVASERGRLTGTTEPACNGHRPSVSVLFASLAQHYGANVLAVLLTGIGDDGVSGLLSIKQRGGWTLAQDESSSAVYGMPRAAMEAGAAREQLSLELICERLVRDAR